LLEGEGGLITPPVVEAAPAKPTHAASTVESEYRTLTHDFPNQSIKNECLLLNSLNPSPNSLLYVGGCSTRLVGC